MSEEEFLKKVAELDKLGEQLRKEHESKKVREALKKISDIVETKAYQWAAARW